MRGDGGPEVRGNSCRVERVDGRIGTPLGGARVQLQTIQRSGGLRFAIPPTNYLALRSVAAQYQGLRYIFDLTTYMVAAYDSAVAENRTTREPYVTLRVGSWRERRSDVAQQGSGLAYFVLRACRESRYPTSYGALYTAFDYAGL
jgi:hypothetical protein